MSNKAKSLLLVLIAFVLTLVGCSISNDIDHSNELPSKKQLNEFSFAEKWNVNRNIQDGCIYCGFLFTFDSTGYCYVYTEENHNFVKRIIMPSYNGILPHCNSVCVDTYSVEEKTLFWLLTQQQ